MVASPGPFGQFCGPLDERVAPVLGQGVELDLSAAAGRRRLRPSTHVPFA
jgi:hypothetical protein